MQFEEYVKPTQRQLFEKLRREYAALSPIAKEDKYLLVPGVAPVVLVAHLDTVHAEPVRHICRTENGGIIMSPQGIGGDDRCGVFALAAVHEQAAVKPWLLFCCEEERGGIGARAFADDYKAGRLPLALGKAKFLLEIDRKGKNDAVFYDCDVPGFTKFITSRGFKEAFGSFSDISTIAPAMGAAAANLSSGYYSAHTQHEYVVRKHLMATVKKVLALVGEACSDKVPRFEYKAARPTVAYGGGYGYGKKGKGGWTDYYSGYGGYGSGYGKWYDYEPGDDDIPDDLPGYLFDDYVALLDLYTAAELNDYRMAYGDQAIAELYEAEIAPLEKARGKAYGGGKELDAQVKKAVEEYKGV